MIAAAGLLLLVPLADCAHIASLNIEQHQGNYSQVMPFLFNQTTEHVLVFPTSDSIYPYRVKAWSSGAKLASPVLVVVRQEREVISWQVPFVVDTTMKDGVVHFHNTSRTLCHNDMPRIAKAKATSRILPIQLSQNFIIALSTSSLANVDISVMVEEERDFYLQEGRPYEVSVSPSESKYYYYKFHDKKNTSAMIEINSDDDVCLTVSIQDSFCPVFDLDKDITYEGKYQTINRKGGMTIRQREFPDGFFLVFVAKADNYQCSQKHSVLLVEHRKQHLILANRTSTITFTINKGINGKEYEIASLATLGALLSFCIVSTIMIFAFTRWGTISKFRPSGDELDADWEEPPEPPITRELKHELLSRQALTVNLLARAPEKDKRRSYNYLWHILSIAIFYSIPVVQLVITYQRVVNRTGDQDMCYYNFLCANPAFGLSDFNHIFSNVGYIIVGILFLGVVLHRQTKIPNSSTGIPVHYGVYYAMGIALIIEGILSACYHICPSQSNYQFDTSFMYVMAVLCMIKLYQNRHPDVNATAYATFTVLGMAIFLAMIGILNGSLTVWIVFVVIYSLLCAYISFKIYFISFVFDGFKQLKQSLKSSNKVEAIAPIRKSRFALLVIANIINYAMLITGLCLYNTGVTDFGTFLLGLLMGNSVLYAVFYTGMKLVNGERICFEAIIYGLLAIAAWATAAVYFLDNATLWTVTPAESRQWNQECIVMSFYDKHDVWHLLSAPALYLTFMFLLSLDDDLVDIKREEITVF
ncbi:Sid-1-related A precursor [Tribolium castaneum]|uniref:Sid-1-related A n=1 Tax=Tribolium castaneum TaxID=7070 RepID=A7YFV8_TRICA|nr:Sid-1-related A precursor [Tribolium castaneum]ABU63672.1 Sid-1-related A [Tribolium castaneum]|eukprot:NP_001099012.1 Sid-1-related A precursor [Tribolium castaneum]